ncbi:MAG: 3-deoxy-D-manno-octulosonic acid transferase [Silicimonas sp.]|nr:3-deoxy-D-manno-octulosonic acid transferase [Silicimonas sp.]
MSPLTWAYLGFSQISGPIWRFAHGRRLQKGKEDPARLAEKYGRYSRERPAGEVIWLHALSVGESLALVPLIEHALEQRPGAHVVLTSSTLTSVRALEGAGLPARCIHVFQPVDTAPAVRRFLDHWRPDVAGFAELDFWPRLMIDTARRGIPMVLINSRMQAGNFVRRSKIRGMTRDVLRLFDHLLVQDGASAERFAALGAAQGRIEVAGALKAVARPLPCDAAERARLAGEIGARFVWLASSTFETEQAAVVAAQGAVLAAVPEALMIWAPRHLRDADAGEALAVAAGLRVARRSRGEAITPEVQVYLADTIGEMGLWYRLAPVSFMGHSLHEDLEGKNPYEAAALGSAILHGPHVAYFAESYAGLAEEGAARVVSDGEALAQAVVALGESGVRDGMVAGAARVVEANRDVLYRSWAALEARL